MNFEDKIKELNEEVKCTLAPSKIHGIGVFALRDIKKDEKLYCAPLEYKVYEIPYKELDNLRPEIRKIIIERWPAVVSDVMFESPNNVGLMSFMNHSDTPNSDKDIATRDIKRGEEVTEDYRLIKDYKKIFTFLCLK